MLINFYLLFLLDINSNKYNTLFMGNCKDFNHDEIFMYIKKELEEDLNDDKESLEINEVQNNFDEPGIQTISDKLNINNNIRINNNNIINNDYIQQNNSNNINNSIIIQPQNQMNNKNKKSKIFNIVKSPRQQEKKIGYKIFKIKKNRHKKNRKRQFINWDTIQFPKEKYFNNFPTKASKSYIFTKWIFFSYKFYKML